MEKSNFVLDGITIGKTQFIDQYNSLLDQNLIGYFNKERRKYLRKVGLLTKGGVILSKKIINYDQQVTFQKSSSVRKFKKKQSQKIKDGEHFVLKESTIGNYQSTRKLFKSGTNQNNQQQFKVNSKKKYKSQSKGKNTIFQGQMKYIKSKENLLGAEQNIERSNIGEPSLDNKSEIKLAGKEENQDKQDYDKQKQEE